jgi:antitoxin HigA-1
MVRVPTDRAPTPPGEVLAEEFLAPMGLTQRQLADAIRVPYQRVNEIVNGRRGVTPATALRLAKFFGTTPDLWLNLQMRWDLYEAQRDQRNELARVMPYRAPASALAAVQESGPAWETDQESDSEG